MVLPPIEVDLPVSDLALGHEIESALRSYRESGRSLTPAEWAVENEQLLHLMNEKSVASFERKKKDVAVRRDRESGEIRLFVAKSPPVVLQAPDTANLGEAVRKLLGV